MWHANTKQKTIHRCFLVILIFPTFVQCAVYVATTRQDYKTTCLLTTLSMVVDRTVDRTMDRGWAVVKNPHHVACCMNRLVCVICCFVVARFLKKNVWIVFHHVNL